MNKIKWRVVEVSNGSRLKYVLQRFYDDDGRTKQGGEWVYVSTHSTQAYAETTARELWGGTVERVVSEGEFGMLAQKRG